MTQVPRGGWGKRGGSLSRTQWGCSVTHVPSGYGGGKQHLWLVHSGGCPQYMSLVGDGGVKEDLYHVHSGGVWSHM